MLAAGHSLACNETADRGNNWFSNKGWFTPTNDDLARNQSRSLDSDLWLKCAHFLVCRDVKSLGSASHPFCGCFFRAP